MSDRTDTKKKKMLEALESTAGIVTQACEKVGISRDTHYRWKRTDPQYRAGVEDVENVALDLAETELLNQIREGNITAIIFFLKTKGKHRGYVESIQEQIFIERRETEDNEEEYNFDQLDIEELDMLEELLEKASVNGHDNHDNDRYPDGVS